MSMDRRNHRLLAFISLFALTFLLYISSAHLHLASGGINNLIAPQLFLTRLKPANATLGFGALIAVSQAHSPRHQGLFIAANATAIDITIPDQPAWNDVDLDSLRAGRNSSISRGSALAWLGHLNALRWFLSTSLQTALILEDDVDWDIRLRTTQIPAAAAVVRRLVSGSTDHPTQIKYESLLDNYWGNSSAWDILYLGHCGDIFQTEALDQTPKILYQDETLPPRGDMHPFTRKFLDGIGLPEKLRLVHRSVSPLCSFGYAITRHAAYRLLTETMPREADDGGDAYDVRILEACRPKSGFRCWSVNPEIFHHADGCSEIGSIDRPSSSKGDVEGGADVEEQTPPVEGRAPNIACSARHRDQQNILCQ